MAHGGARNRSGPRADEKSERSDRRDFKLTALPSDGYQGEAPKFPLIPRRVSVWMVEDKVRFQVHDADASKVLNDREAELWAWAWSTPQACAWSLPSERWRIQTIAMWVRTFVICESDDATAADKASLHRFADQIGLTTAGLAEMGWKVAVDELQEKRAEHAEQQPAAAPKAAPVRRLRGDAKP